VPVASIVSSFVVSGLFSSGRVILAEQSRVIVYPNVTIAGSSNKDVLLISPPNCMGKPAKATLFDISFDESSGAFVLMIFMESYSNAIMSQVID
jgi:hypothetical protein